MLRKILFSIVSAVYAVNAVRVAFFDHDLSKFDSVYACAMTAILFLIWTVEAE